MLRLTALIALVLAVCAAAASARPLDPQAADDRVDGSAAGLGPTLASRDADGKVTLRANRLPEALTLDGRLAEPFYEHVEPVSDFVQQEPFEGKPATEKTEVWIFFDEKNFYVAARCWESDSSKRVTSDMRRDSQNLYNNDHFSVLVDTFLDRRSGYAFMANSQGGIQDTLVTNEQPNPNWNTIWEVRTGTFEHGWTIEYRIPFRSLRYRANAHVWGINFRRMVRWKSEISFLTPIPAAYGRRALMMVSYAGSVGSLDMPGNGINLDIKPYALASNVTDRAATPVRDHKGDFDAGADVKWTMTQQLVADLTYNTDFAQVEDDEQQVNLTRFSLFFPEKREFFLEGQEVFNFAGAADNGRGGGGPPGGSGGGGGGPTAPNNTPILFFSRRIGLNDDRVVPILGGGRLLGRAGPYHFGALSMHTSDAPEANALATDFSVLRVNRDILRRSRIGFLATRRAPKAGHDNYAYGADLSVSFADTLSVTSYWAKTETPGRGSNDTSYRGQFNWNADRYGLQLEHLFVGEDFNPEVGFLRREAFRRSYGQVRFSPRPKNLRGVRKLAYEAGVDYVTNPRGAVESKEAQGTFRVEFDSGDQWSAEFARSFEFLAEEFEVAKNIFVPVGGYTFQQVKSIYMLGPQRPINGSVTFTRGSFYEGNLTELSWRGRVELSSRLYLEPNLSWNHVDMPWGHGNTNLVSARATYTVSPRMFVAALLQYQSRNDSMSTNARFRWEYRPGSELFVVYSDGRDTLGHGFPSMVNQSLVVKATRLFRW